MQFSLLENFKNIFFPEKPVVDSTAELQHALRNMENNKAFWNNQSSISASGIAAIHRLHELDRGYSVSCWKCGNPNIKELMLLLRTMFGAKKISNVTIDISEISGFSASCSNLSDFVNMRQFVEANCRRYFDITTESLKKNLAHGEIRIINREKPTDYLKIYGWSEKMYLINSGGSHHLASAQYIAKELNELVPITGRMDLVFLDREGLNHFLKKFSSLLIPVSDFAYLSPLFKNSGLDCVFYKASYLPSEYLIMFYEHQALPMDIDSMMKSMYTDFNNELIKFYVMQQENSVFNKYNS